MSTQQTIESSDHRSTARTALVIAAVVTGLLYVIPYGEYIIYPLMLFSTYAHEMGHGLTAELVGGNFVQFQMWADGSGVASHTGNYGGLAQALVAAGGLAGPAVLGSIFFVVGQRERWARIALGVFGAMVLLSVLLVVRNGFGIGFAVSLGAICLLSAWFLSDGAARTFLVFLAIQLSLTVFSRGDYLFMKSAQTSAGRMPSDVSQISNALFGPYWLWGALVGLFSILVLVFGVWGFFRATRET